jgi:signal transduction histidine kinase
MAEWIAQHFLQFVGMVVVTVAYVVRIEAAVAGLKERMSACEKRADEDRHEIKERLDSIEQTGRATKSAVDQIVGALHGRRRITDGLPESMERL